MKDQKNLSPEITKKIQKFTKTAQVLRDGTSTYFPITQLTSIKSLCQDKDEADRFVFYLAERVQEKVNASVCPPKKNPQEWEKYKGVINEAVPLMKRHLQKPNEESKATLRTILPDLENIQELTGQQKWDSPVRAIFSTEVLIIENAILCMLSPHDASTWAYRTARNYAEAYNPRYGTGLIPESAPMLEDIIRYFEENWGLQ